MESFVNYIRVSLRTNHQQNTRLINIWVIVIIFFADWSLNETVHRYGRHSRHHTHHHHHHRPHHKCRYGWHHLPSTTSFWPETVNTDATRFDSDPQIEYAPHLKLEYHLPSTDVDYALQKEIIKETDIFEPGTLYHQNKNQMIVPYQFHTSWDDPQHSNVLRIKKIKHKKKKKTKLPKPIKEILYPELLDFTTPSYSSVTNKIIVIDESDKSDLDSNSVERQIVKSFIDKENMNFLNQKNIQTDVKPESVLMEKPESTLTGADGQSKPILTIKDLHERLNQTLLFKVPENEPEIKRISYNGSLMIPSNLNETFQTSGTKFENQDYFIKSNHFAFQKNWNYPTTTEPTNESMQTNYTKSNNEQLVSSGSTNRHWLSSTTPPVVYFTSQRSISSTVNPIARQTIISSTSIRKLPMNKHHENYNDKNLEISAAKRGSQLNDNNNSNERISGAALDVRKIGSIIFAFCISMMLLAGVIVIVLHKDTVSEQFRNIAERFPRFPPNSNENSPAGDHHSSSPQLSPDLSEPFPSNIPPPPPPPPPLMSPPPPPTQPKVNHQHLIEQVIGRPENSYNDKKCRHYFSRVHRWVPKRPPLPTDLVGKE